MIERHWERIAAYCGPENRAALGFVEGFNNKIRFFNAEFTAWGTRRTCG